MRRRWKALAALLLLIFLAGAGLWRLARGPFGSPVGTGATGPLRLLPPEALPRPPAGAPAGLVRASRSDEAELTIAQFLGILATKRRTAATERFLEGFAGRPRLLRVLKDLRREGGDSAPAGVLVGALAGQREFRELLSEFRDDPGFREAVADAASDPRLGRTLSSHATVGPSGEIELLAPARGARPGADSTGGAHAVAARLGSIRRDVGERPTTLRLPSAFSAMEPRERERLEETCERYGFCDPVSACRVAELWLSCAAACGEGGNCPEELLSDEEPDVPIVVPDGF